MNYQLKKVLRSISKIILLIVGLGLLGYVGYLTYESVTYRPTKVRVTNITDSSFTVSWVTDSPMKGVVYYKDSNSFLPGPLVWLGAKKGYDDRDFADAQSACVREFNRNADISDDFVVDGSNFDCENISVKEFGEYYTHHVTVKDLDSSKEYYFRVGDGYFSWGVDGVVNAKTFDTLDTVKEPIPIFGRVGNSDGLYSDDSLVYAKFKNGRDDLESVYYSSVTSGDGGWYLDGSYIRTESGVLVGMESGQDLVEVSAQFMNYSISSVYEWVFGSFNGGYPDILVDVEENSVRSFLDRFVLGVNAEGVCSYSNMSDCSNETLIANAAEWGYGNVANAIAKKESNGVVNQDTMKALGLGGSSAALAANISAIAGGQGVTAKEVEDAGDKVYVSNGVATAGTAPVSKFDNCESDRLDSRGQCIEEVEEKEGKEEDLEAYQLDGSGASMFTSLVFENYITRNDGAIYCVSTDVNPDHFGNCDYMLNPIKIYNLPLVTDQLASDDDPERFAAWAEYLIALNNQLSVFGGYGDFKIKKDIDDSILIIQEYYSSLNTGSSEQGEEEEEPKFSRRTLDLYLKEELEDNKILSTANREELTVTFDEDSDNAVTIVIELYKRSNGSVRVTCKENCAGNFNIDDLPQDPLLNNTEYYLDEFIETLHHYDSSYPLELLKTFDEDIIYYSPNTKEIVLPGNPGSDDNKEEGSSILNKLITPTYAQETSNTTNSSYFYLPEYGFYTLEMEGIELGDKVQTGENIIHFFYIEANGTEGFQMPEDIENPKPGEDIVLQSNAFEIKYTKTANSQSINLKKGINIISFENILKLKEYGNGNSAMDLLIFAKEKGINIRSISNFEGGKWSNGVQCSSADKEDCYGVDFNIIPGKGYVLISEENTTLNIPVYTLQSSVPISLSSGWNLIGIHGYSKAYTAKSLIESINKIENITADNVTWWPTSKGKYEGIQVTNGTTYGLDFPISTNNGYFVRISKYEPQDSSCKSIIWNEGGDLHGACGNSRSLF